MVGNIQEKVDFLSGENFIKAKKYEEQKELIKTIKFRIKKANLFLNNDGQIGVNVEYEIPPIKIYFDDDGQMLKNERFFAINSLDMISREDMQKIQLILEEAIERNKKL